MNQPPDKKLRPIAARFGHVLLLAVSAGVWGLALTAGQQADAALPQTLGDKVVIAYNELGMHCMNQDFSEICILPPFNTMKATVIDRSSDDPRIVTSGVTLEYSVPGNTVSHTKTNFWDYAFGLFGVNLPPDIGLAGNGLSGGMAVTADSDWSAVGIPVTPITDLGVQNPYQLAQIIVRQNGVVKDTTQAVIPVSWEIRCDTCHRPRPGVSTAMDILQKHDRKHETTLVNEKPVLCAKCHADPALGTVGVPGVSTMSSAMHLAHSKRPFPIPRAGSGSAPPNDCYSCHPGNQTQCLRDVHYTRGITCVNCHGNLKAMGNPARKPWADEPRCGTCHNVPGHEYEQPGKLFKDSVGHSGVKCVVCHNSPHAIVPTITGADNLQMIRVQGHAGTLDKCTVCHRVTPSEPFFHKRDD